MSRLGLANVVDREVLAMSIAAVVPPEWPGSAEAYAQHVLSGEARSVLRVGVDPGAPEGDQTATVEIRRGELGEIERMRVVTGPERRAFADMTKDARRQRTAKEMARAFAIQQPQGLGLLFPGLRPKGQR